MPDFAACDNHECKKRNECARYLMVKEFMQTVLVIEDPEGCSSFWDMEGHVPFETKER